MNSDLSLPYLCSGTNAELSDIYKVSFYGVVLVNIFCFFHERGFF